MVTKCQNRGHVISEEHYRAVEFIETPVRAKISTDTGTLISSTKIHVRTSEIRESS